MPEMGEGSRRGIQTVEPSSRTDPYYALGVLVDADNVVVAQAPLIAGTMLEMRKGVLACGV